jgi:hypothetical protein
MYVSLLLYKELTWASTPVRHAPAPVRDPALVHVRDSSAILPPSSCFHFRTSRPATGPRPLPPAPPLSPETIVAPSSVCPFCPPHQHGLRPSPWRKTLPRLPDTTCDACPHRRPRSPHLPLCHFNCLCLRIRWLVLPMRFLAFYTSIMSLISGTSSCP